MSQVCHFQNLCKKPQHGLPNKAPKMKKSLDFYYIFISLFAFYFNCYFI